MIQAHRFLKVTLEHNGEQILINIDIIETIEPKPGRGCKVFLKKSPSIRITESFSAIVIRLGMS